MHKFPIYHEETILHASPPPLLHQESKLGYPRHQGRLLRVQNCTLLRIWDMHHGYLDLEIWVINFSVRDAKKSVSGSWARYILHLPYCIDSWDCTHARVDNVIEGSWSAILATERRLQSSNGRREYYTNLWIRTWRRQACDLESHTVRQVIVSYTFWQCWNSSEGAHPGTAGSSAQAEKSAETSTLQDRLRAEQVAQGREAAANRDRRTLYTMYFYWDKKKTNVPEAGLKSNGAQLRL
jgi:hypothetical protein